MRIDNVIRIAAVHSDSAADFEKQFNARIDELEGFKIVDRKIEIGGGSFDAVLVYEETHRVADSVKDEYHFEGIRYLCKHCPYLDDPKDKRVKYCKCKYAELGMTHKDTEACEMFYRHLKAGRITPLEDYER